MRLYKPVSELTPAQLHERRERTFLVFAGLFLGTLAMLNILGISRFIVLASWAEQDGQWLFKWGEPIFGPNAWIFAVAIGVLPYPLTFLCTDFISEFYGRRRASFVVWIGLLLNLWVVFILWVGGALPGFSQIDPSLGYPVGPEGAPLLPEAVPPDQTADGAGYGIDHGQHAYAFYRIRELAFGAVLASMIAYLVAQFVDVYVFHFWKRLTKGKHLWLRNNGSTMISQLVDTTAVILITHFYARALPIDGARDLWPQLILFIFTGYAFKFISAAVDTGPFYLGAAWLRDFLGIDNRTEHAADEEETGLSQPVATG